MRQSSPKGKFRPSPGAPSRASRMVQEETISPRGIIPLPAFTCAAESEDQEVARARREGRSDRRPAPVRRGEATKENGHQNSVPRLPSSQRRVRVRRGDRTSPAPHSIRGTLTQRLSSKAGSGHQNRTNSVLHRGGAKRLCRRSLLLQLRRACACRPRWPEGWEVQNVPNHNRHALSLVGPLHRSRHQTSP